MPWIKNDHININEIKGDSKFMFSDEKYNNLQTTLQTTGNNHVSYNENKEPEPAMMVKQSSIPRVSVDLVIESSKNELTQLEPVIKKTHTELMLMEKRAEELKCIIDSMSQIKKNFNN